MNTPHENTPAPDDFWEIQLRAHLLKAQTYIPDDGFTHNVIASLPAPKKHPKWMVFLHALPYLLTTCWVLWQWVSLGDVKEPFWLQYSTEQLLRIGFGVSLVSIALLMVWFKWHFHEDWV
jgi:hypothetical protein